MVRALWDLIGALKAELRYIRTIKNSKNVLSRAVRAARTGTSPYRINRRESHS